MKFKNIIWVLVFILILAGGIYTHTQLKGRFIDETFGSVTVGNEYSATSTPFQTGWTDQQLDLGNGALGSVVVTLAGTTGFRLMDATSTESYNRGLGGDATSTRILANIPPSLAAGTYVFDVTYRYGLFLDVYEGSTGTSTITFR